MSRNRSTGKGKKLFQMGSMCQMATEISPEVLRDHSFRLSALRLEAECPG